MFMMHYPYLNKLSNSCNFVLFILFPFYLHNPVIFVGSSVCYMCRKKKLANDVEKVII